MLDKPYSNTSKNQPVTRTVRLTHAALMTQNLDQAIEFYTSILGLDLRVDEEDPIRTGHRRAMLADRTDTDVIELIEYPNMMHTSVPGRGAVNHIGFSMPERIWHSLRSRLDESGYPYQEIDGRLFLRDPDEVVLEIETE